MECVLLITAGVGSVVTTGGLVLNRIRVIHGKKKSAKVKKDHKPDSNG
jgi:hypothetical protein